MKAFQQIEREVCQYYTRTVSEHGDTAKGMDWKDRDSQYLRFYMLSQLFRTRAGFSLLDIGCGTGELLVYLRQNGFENIRYTGLDLSGAMLEKARLKFEGDKDVSLINATAGSLDQRFDYVVSSGIFNVKSDQPAEVWLDYIKAMLADHHRLAGIGFAANFLTSYVDFTVPHLYYCDPCAIFDYCRRNFSRFVSIRHDTRLYEFTLYTYREPLEAPPALT